MTRLIADLLGHSGASFRLGLQQLERSAGCPSHDIRLAASVLQTTQTKLHELGLDRHDTTGRELYAALGRRLEHDETRLAVALRGQSPESDDPIAHVARTLKAACAGQNCFALKNSTAKKLLRTYVPRRTMKALGYRSVDSLLKHEAVAQLFAAASLLESDAWSKRMIGAYARLQQTDFEVRALRIEHPTSSRWQQLAETVVALKKHHILSFKELGAVVLLPLPAERPPLVVLTTTVLAVHAVNSIQAASTFLKLHQTRQEFGPIVQQIVIGEPTLRTRLLDMPVSWHVVQRYYAQTGHQRAAQVFEPVVHAEDFVWHSVESVVADIDASLSYWRGTGHLALMHDGQVVSCNLTDAVLSYCNGLPFAKRLRHNFQHALHTELMLMYLSHERLEQAIVGELHRELATEPATI